MSMIGTSINIEKSRLTLLNNTSELLNLSETELLSILLKRSRRLFGDRAVIKQTVKYQRDSDSDKYTIHHVEFKDVDYEFATGRRYMFKISVSFLIRLAIDYYLKDIIREWTVNRAKAEADWDRYLTNFHYECFDVVRYAKELVEIWVIPWPRE